MSLAKLPALPTLGSLPNIRISRPAKLAILGASLSVALIGILAAYLRRKRSRKFREEQRKNHRQKQASQSGKSNLVLSPNGDLPHRGRRSGSPNSVRSVLHRQKSGSISSLGGASTGTTSTITHSAVDITNLSPVQVCQLGLDTLQVSISYWEDAIMKLSADDDSPHLAIPDSDTMALQHQLENLLDMAYKMQDTYDRQYERYADHIALDSAIAAFTEADRMSIGRRSLDMDSSSDQESFVSATDMADLSDLDTHRELFHHLALYEAGLLELKHGHIPCRTLRPEMTQCLSDTEYLAKLHGIRLAMEVIFKDPSNKDYFAKMGCQLLSNLLLKTDRDTEGFITAFEQMQEFVNNSENWTKMEEELRGRGVKSLSFFDVVLDFILMDAFDDLDNPPSSVIAVVQNRWLSNGFKETALCTAVWSVLKAKRRLLKFPDGFIAHFYSLSEHISPVLAWGFLGPESDLKDLCTYFKDLVLGFIRDMFSFEKARYTTVDDLATDILNLCKARSEEATEKLTARV